MDLLSDITGAYISRIRYHEDILGVVLKGHLLIEYVLDLFIEKGLKNPKPILDDHRTYSFSVKSRLLFESSLIEETTFNNIVRVNKIRNELAHNLSINVGKIDFEFSKIKKGESIDVDLSEVVKTRYNPTKRYLFLLCFGTLSTLQTQYYSKFGTYPLLDKPIELGEENAI
jgi:hypothetical protein